LRKEKAQSRRERCNQHQTRHGRAPYRRKMQ
jgi:hypothetical protein